MVSSNKHSNNNSNNSNNSNIQNMLNIPNIRFFDNYLNTFINIENLHNNVDDDYLPPLIDINEELFFSTINEYYFYLHNQINL
jgi:hypothetical protein